jgi:23S rRNA pseudouridine2605 synthase
VRLNAFVAKSGVCARRQAAELIKQGKVKVGGKVMLEPWYVVKEKDAVTVGGRRVNIERCHYLVMNKPRGVTSTAGDKFAEKKITDLIPRKYGRLYPVGRLDKDSRGLIVLTNDGELCHNITHPKFEVEKEYRVVAKGEFDDVKLASLKRGITDEGEVLKVKSCLAANSKNDITELVIIILEGKKRHIRRMLKCLGLSVLDLKRVRIGGLKLKGLAEGAFVGMEKEDIYNLVFGRT